MSFSTNQIPYGHADRVEVPLVATLTSSGVQDHVYVEGPGNAFHVGTLEMVSIACPCRTLPSLT